MRKALFDVDHEGLRKVLGDKPRGRLLLELVQNALDEDVRTVKVDLQMVPDKRATAVVRVEDDSPEGFRDLTDAYTLFAPSYKASDPEKIGCYNLGEKLVIAVCRQVTITTTKGTVVFDVARSERHEKRAKREAGTVFEGEMKMTREEHEEALSILRTVIVPDGVTMALNGEPLPERSPVHSFTAALETRILNGEGEMARTTRKTTVSVYNPLPGESATIYEKAMPVVATGDKWHVSVGQKVPTNKDRNNVSPAYLHQVRLLVLNEMHQHLTEEDTSAPWIDDAADDERCEAEATRKIIHGRFGDKVVGCDPSDREAEKTATMHGNVVVPPRAIPPILRKRAAGVLLPAGQVFPTYDPYSGGPDAKPVEFLDEEKWTDGIHHIARYAQFLASEVLGIDIAVRVLHPNSGKVVQMVACWCKGVLLTREELHFNLVKLGHNWFDTGVREAVDNLLIHEMGHHLAGDHLSEEFHEALCRIGAKLKALAVHQPEKLKAWYR